MPLVGFQGDGRGDGTRMPLDIAPDHHGNSHLGHDAPVSRNRSCQQAVPRLPQTADKKLPPVGSQRHNRDSKLFVHAFDRSRAQADDDRQRQNGLADGNSGQVKQQPEVAQRAATGDKCINEQADEYGRQRHQGVDKGSQRLFPAEVKIAEAKAQRDSDQQAAADRVARHL